MSDKIEKKDLLVDIQGLTRGYPKSPNLIFNKFDFKLYKNEFYFILGKSGVGKTTLTKFLIRQLQLPKKMVFYRKEDISRFTDNEVQAYRRKIGVIFQDYKLIDRKTVSQNISYPLEISGVSADKIEKKLNDILYKLGLMDKKDSMIPMLSGGEKQRVAIARALISSPEFIIADEPTGNLDQDTSERIVDVLINLNMQGNTILFITHNLQLVNYATSLNPNIKVINI